ncbi:hypothetical protein PKHYL_04310 [Psychrobacter sp. KH172YL61]|uniref:hypothetical protein n=1 Tax=Psychrobacter sp. KH172YL61 TaxID=2517899 RepID=UPI0010BABA73|nr:hypothetical protein [Psychrobacter sp. KH172YL61]BBI66240.1 hypothetical protein PKHYL_04310 [Psychrobacter sp. KH172YL61]
MKRLNTVSPMSGKVALPLKYLVVAMAAMVALPVAQADVAGKKIGDLEIYKAAEGGKTTITMMLDTSGSMTLNQVNSAVTCDIPVGTNYTKGFENSNTVPIYRKDYCETTKFYYRKRGNTWYSCGASDGSGSFTYGVAECDTEIVNPTTNGFISGTANGNTYYYKNNVRIYDRLTRLKDAIFTLMDNTQLDPNKVAIGIGQFSSQSNSDNVVEFNTNGTAKNADGSSGKILVPAELLNDVQRLKIKVAVAAAGGGNGTPTANAYAEAGAYMLGKILPLHILPLGKNTLE